MHSNVIAFTARPRTQTARKTFRRTDDNVIPLASWIGRAVPRRTSGGVVQTTLVLAAPGEIA